MGSYVYCSAASEAVQVKVKNSSSFRGIGEESMLRDQKR